MKMVDRSSNLRKGLVSGEEGGAVKESHIYVKLLA